MSVPLDSNGLPMLAQMDEVRDLVYGITGQQFPDEKVTKSLEYGNSEVCDQTDREDWNKTMRQWAKAVQAANYYAASNLVPKTIQDNDTGVPLYVTYRKIGQQIIQSINDNMVSAPDSSTVIVIKSTKNRNYYTNQNAEPYMTPDAFGGKYNRTNNEHAGVENLT